MYRNYLLKGLALVILICCFSCADRLDKDPLGILDAGSFFNSTDDALKAVNAAYGPLLFSNDNNNFLWVFGTVASDNAIAGGDGSRAGVVEIDFFEHTPRTQEFNDFWKLNYGGIIQCNTVIEKTPKVEGNADLKQRIIGEALFLRAHYYLTLVQVFGRVPLIIEIQPPDAVRVPRNSVAEILNQVVQDCADAAQMLPVSHSGNNTGRATRGAALALMAKSQLYQQNWGGVVATVGQIKSLGAYSLMPDYMDNFREGTQNNAESVWEIQHENLELGVGNNLNQWWASKKVPDGYGFAEVTQELVDAFEPGDPRLGFTVAAKNEDYFGVVYKPSFSSTGFSPRKYLQPVAEVTQKSDGGINYTVVRYAEVLLWEAEAQAQLGQLAAAQAALEEVRARARNQALDPTTTLPMIIATDQQTMIEAIRHERRVELAFELHRFFDLVRWGIAAQVLEDFVPAKHEVFPIPQTELDLNPMLDQNPGY